VDRPGEDALLIRRCLEGDREAFSHLVIRHQKMVINTVYRFLGQYDDACEVAQEVFVAAYRALNNFRQESKFSTWLYRIAVDQAKNRLKSLAALKYSSADPPDLPSSSQTPDQVYDSKALRETVQHALMGLDPEDREVIVLRDIEGQSYEAVAEILDLPVGTIKSRLHRARMALREKLAPYLKDVL